MAKKCQKKCELNQYTQKCNGCGRTLVEIVNKGIKMTSEKMQAHKRKMARKAAERDLRHRSTGIPLVLANISQHHMDYGMSLAEHLRAKAERAKNNS